MKAVAERSDEISVDDLDDLIDGTSNKQIKAPLSVRTLLQRMDLVHILTPVNLFEYGAWTNEIFANEQRWEYLKIEVDLDSGSICHVISEGDAPCCALDSSPAA